MKTLPNIFPVIVGSGLLFFIFFLIAKLNTDQSERKGISAEFGYPIPATAIKNDQRLSYLYSVMIELDKFKDIHKRYPISPDEGKGWIIGRMQNGIIEPWIDGISSLHAKKLLGSSKDNLQELYVYQSDGSNYKILVYFMPDCENVIALGWQMIKHDRHNQCVGYGFWTKRSMWDSDPFPQDQTRQ